MILWWCCPPALPSTRVLLCLPTRPCPADTCPRLCRYFEYARLRKKEGSVLSVHALCRSLDASPLLGGVGATDRVPSAEIRPYSSPPEDPDQRRAVGREPSVERRRGVGLASHPRARERDAFGFAGGIAGQFDYAAPSRGFPPLSRSAAPAFPSSSLTGRHGCCLFGSPTGLARLVPALVPLSRRGPFRGRIFAPRWIFYTDRPLAATLT